jgi:hypothetical protein
MGAKKGSYPQSTWNRVLFRNACLILFQAMKEANTNKLGKRIGTKKKLSKRELCIYMAEHNHTFRAFWIRAHPSKKFPKDMNKRAELGLDFYKNVLTDKRRNKIDPPFKKHFKLKYKILKRK